ncbi:MAG: ABC transporter permease [Planctomycetes bacterium]|nr:ABC transporter permease [Planctomycetota bacterium]
MSADANRKGPRFVEHRAARAWILCIMILTAASFAAPIFTNAESAQNLALGATPPSWAHLLGTDALGRDLAIRMLDGARISLLIGAGATLLSVLIGVPYGAAAGYFGGRADGLLMAAVDILYGLPSILFVLLLLAWFGREPGQSMLFLFIGLGAISWLTTARIVRARCLAIRELDFVTSARLSGVSHARIILKHLIPQTSGAVIAYATLTMPRVMMEEAFLSFLGLGVAPPRASWGTLLNDGMQSFREYPWLVLAPGIALAVTLAAFYNIGDALRDAFDPRERPR